MSKDVPGELTDLVALGRTLKRRCTAAGESCCGQESVAIHDSNAQLKTHLRGPGKILRSESPDLVKQEIWGYLLTHYAISALACTAATAAGIDPDRVKLRRTVARHNHYPVRKPGQHGTRHDAPPAVKLANSILTRENFSTAA